MVFYAIPSYNRPDGLYKKTLTVLKNYNIDSKDITIFLHTDEEKKSYESVIPKEYYGKIVVHYVAEPHKVGSSPKEKTVHYVNKGIGKIRNYIMDYYKLGEEVVSLDDDVNGFMMPVNGKLKPIKSFKELVKKAFVLCKENKFSLWGLYPVCNAYFMKGTPITKDLRFIVGSCVGFINKRRYVSLDLKEDYEFSLINYEKDGGLIRFNTICVKHNTNSKKGGIGKDQHERLEGYKKASKYLMDKYADNVILNKRKDGEILLRSFKNKTLKK